MSYAMQYTGAKKGGIFYTIKQNTIHKNCEFRAEWRPVTQQSQGQQVRKFCKSSSRRSVQSPETGSQHSTCTSL